MQINQKTSGKPLEAEACWLEIMKASRLETTHRPISSRTPRAFGAFWSFLLELPSGARFGKDSG